jgi:hypothetical protein
MSLVTREMQNHKTHTEILLRLVRTATEGGGGGVAARFSECGVIRIFVSTAGLNVKWCSHCGKQHGISSKVKHHTTTGSSNSTSGGTESRVLKRHLYTCVPRSSTNSSQEMEATLMPSNRGIGDKTQYTFHRVLFSLKKEGNLPHVTI